MIIKTRKLPATQNDSERMRATSSKGHILTVPFPYSATDPDESVANALALALGKGDTLARRDTHTWEV